MILHPVEQKLTEDEWRVLVDESMKNFEGQLDNFYEAVGMVTTGRLLGWRVMRLVSSRRCWSLATKLFGDPKELMPERGKYYDKSVGIKIVDSAGEYWEYIKGHKPISLGDRKTII